MMKSFQVERLRNDDTITGEEYAKYSELQVLKSDAGYYIGTTFKGEHFNEPGSRDTSYFETEEVAKEALELLENLYRSHGVLCFEPWEVTMTRKIGRSIEYRFYP